MHARLVHDSDEHFYQEALVEAVTLAVHVHVQQELQCLVCVSVSVRSGITGIKQAYE